MFAHVRANLCLLVLTLLLCCVLYPLVLWGVGRTFFAAQADGSLIDNTAGRPVGSRLIAQAFTGDEWFQPRPSAASYNAAASGASNWGASNPLLRDRVARQLGPIVKYVGGPKKGQSVGPDIEAWFRERPDRAAAWAKDHPTLAGAWVKSDDSIKAYVSRWATEHPEVTADWVKDNPDKEYDAAKPEDAAVQFFASYGKAHPGTWPSIVETKTADGKSEKAVKPAKEGTDIQAAFFDSWLQEHADADLEKVPADMVTASGSGLDPHVTLRNALWQLARVVAARSATEADRPGARQRAEALLQAASFTPLGGLAGGEPLVNVLEVNLALDRALPRPAR
jgi:K+-transporting ATPase ATPase C chain